MANVFYNLSQVLGMTIIHSLWQGLLIYFLLKATLMSAPRLPASKRYILAVFSLTAILAWFAFTLVNEIQMYSWLALQPAHHATLPIIAELPATLRQLGNQNLRYYYSIERYLPYISIIYAVGLLFNASKLIVAQQKINVIRTTMSIDVKLQLQLTKLTHLLKISTKVRIGLSKLVDVPCMTGYLRPIILLPFTLSTYLSEDEVEAILLHELAHIKRNDYLINICQQVVSVLLFFNPCVILINRIINEERENCCDDMVVASTTSPLTYAKALLKLDQTVERKGQLQLAATGTKYQLLNRIERIMKTKKPIESIRPAILAMLLLTLGIGALALLHPEIAQGKISVKSIRPILNRLVIDTTRKNTAKKTIPVKHYNTRGNNNMNVKKTDGTWSDFKDDYNFRWNFHDAQLEKLSKEIEKHGQAIGKFYESGDFKKQTEELEKRGKAIEDYYNKPELKKLQLEQEKLGADYAKNWSETAETKRASADMEAAGKKIEKYFTSKEFKELNERLEKKYGILHNHNYFDDRNENYKKYQAELNTHIPADITKQTEELKALGEKMRQRYDSPEFHAQTARIKAMGDSMKIAFNNPEMKQQQDELRELGKKVGGYNHNPEIQREQQALADATAKLHAYMNTPEFKKRFEKYKKDRHTFQWDEHKESQEKPEKPEQPEQPEKPETNN